jgi:acyl carrier protein
MMSPDDVTTRLRVVVANAISTIAPDVTDELPDLDPDADLFEEYGLDSMDRLNIMTALAQSTGVEIPDDRYPQLTSMNRLIAHLATAP